MNWTSLVRGLIAASFVAVALAVASTEVDVRLAALLLVPAHAIVPIAAAWWGKKPDVLALDVGLAGVGVVYTLVLLFMPNGGWSGGTCVGVAIGYAAYAVTGALGFAALAKWRRVLRIRGIRRVRAERAMMRAEMAGPAE